MDDQYFEDIMVLTGSPEYKALVAELERIVYNIQANALEATSWDRVLEDKGYAKGLAYIINLRENSKTERKANADV